MKKISGILLTLLLIATLASCGKNGLSKKEEKNILTVTEFEVSRRKVSYELKLNDPKDKLKGRTFIAKLTYDKIEVQTDKLTFGEDEDEPNDTLMAEFKNLVPDRKYNLTITVSLGVKDKVETYTLVNKDFETLVVGTTIDNPVLISTVSEFLEIGKTTSDEGKVYYKLANDLDFLEYDPEDGIYNHNFTTSNRFIGEFDGDGYTIKNFRINSRKTYLGLFPYNEGVIKNLNIDNAKIELVNRSDSSQYIGFISGRNNGTINNVNITNSSIETNFNLTNKTYIGGLVGKAEAGTVIKKSTANIDFDISTDSRTEFNVGAITGFAEDSEFTNLVVNTNINLTHAYKGNIGGAFGLIGDKTKVNEVNVNSSLTISTNVKSINTSVKPYDRIEVSIGGAIGKSEDNSTVNDLFVKTNIDIIEAKNTFSNQSPSDKYLVGGVVGLSVSNSSYNQIYSEPTILLGSKEKEAEEELFKNMDNIYVGGIAGQMHLTSYTKVFAANTDIEVNNDFGTYYLSPLVGINSVNDKIDFNNSSIKFNNLTYLNKELLFKEEELEEVDLITTELEDYFDSESYIGNLLK